MGILSFNSQMYKPFHWSHVFDLSLTLVQCFPSFNTVAAAKLWNFINSRLQGIISMCVSSNSSGSVHRERKSPLLTRVLPESLACQWASRSHRALSPTADAGQFAHGPRQPWQVAPEGTSHLPLLWQLIGVSASTQSLNWCMSMINRFGRQAQNFFSMM